jgi:hypothetical protein
MGTRLSVKRCAAAAFRSTLQDWEAFFHRNWAWFVIGYVVREIIVFRVPLSIDFRQVIYVAFVAVISAPIAVGWHRHILVDDRSTGLRTIRFGHRQARFLVTSLTLMVIAVIPVLVLTIVILRFFVFYFSGAGSSPGLAVAIPVGIALSCWAWTRMCLALPMVAINAGSPFRASWEYTRGHAWKLFLLLTVTLLPLTVLAFIVEMLEAMTRNGQIVYVLLFDLVRFAITVEQICLGAAAISFAYRDLATRTVAEA